MRKIILLCVCIILQLFMPNVAIAQSQYKIDSLLNELNTSKEDSVKVKILNAVSRLLWKTSDFLNARKYAEDALQLAEKINIENGKSDAYYNLGVICLNQGNYPEALKNHFTALKIYEDIKNKHGIAESYNNIGVIYEDQGNYPEALKNHFAALKIREELGDKPGIATSYTNIGVMYVNQGNYPQALQNFLATLKIWEEIGDEQGIGGCNENIANIYWLQSNYSQALKYHFAALKINEKIGNKRRIAGCYLNIANVYDSQGNHSEALKYTLAALKILKDIGDKQGIAATYINLGDSYIQLKNYSEAKKYLNDGLSLSKEIESKDYIKECYAGLARLDSAIGNYKQSLEHYKLYAIYKDSLFNESKSMQIEELNTKYETGKKDDEIILLTKDKELQNSVIKSQKLIKNYFIGGFIALLLVFILFYKNYRTKQLLKLQTLRNRIASDLHDDVGSTLSSISIFSELAKQQSKEVIPLLDNISESSRKMLESMADIVWTINPENDNFEKIIGRMRSFAYELLRAKNIDFEFSVDETVARMKLPMEARKNLYLIFKEAINNMVKYSGADRAFFSINGTKNNLAMLIRDNGKGFDVHQPSEGNGLRNMKKRAEEIGGKLLIDSGPEKGTSIQFLLTTV